MSNEAQARDERRGTMIGLVILLIVATLYTIWDVRSQQRLSAQRVEQLDHFYTWMKHGRIMRERRELWLRGERWY
jgi:hypothetical protein